MNIGCFHKDVVRLFDETRSNSCDIMRRRMVQVQQSRRRSAVHFRRCLITCAVGTESLLAFEFCSYV